MISVPKHGDKVVVEEAVVYPSKPIEMLCTIAPENSKLGFIPKYSFPFSSLLY